MIAASQPNQRQIKQHQDLVVLTVGLALFNDILLLLMLVPMLPVLISDASPTNSDMRLAVLFATKDIFQVICAPLAGMATLRLGPRVSFAASLFGLAASTVAFAEAHGYRMLLCARALQGVTSAALMTGGLSLITLTHKPSDRASAIARAHSGLGLGAAAGPVLGGLLYDWIGRRATFYAAAGLVLFTFVAQLCLTFMAPAGLALYDEGSGSGGGARGARSAAEQQPALAQLLALLTNRDIRVAALGILAAYACGGVFDAMFGVHVADVFGFDPSRASLLFAIEPIAYLALLTVLAPLADGVPFPWWTKPRLSALGLALTALSLPLMPLGSSLASVVASLLVHGAGYAARDTVGHGLLADLVDRHKVGSYAMAFALADCADSVGYIVGPIVGFALARWLRSRTAALLAVGAICAALSPAIARVAA